MKRYEIWSADLPEKAGSPCNLTLQPVIIVSDSADSAFVTVLPLKRDSPSHINHHRVLLSVPPLDPPYYAKFDHLTSIPKDQLISRIGYMEEPFDRFALNRALASYLGFTASDSIYIQEGNIYEYSGNL